MTTVYIVTSGSYSDYGISSVWDNYEDARARADAESGSRVEEYVLNSSAKPHPPLWEAKYFDGELPNKRAGFHHIHSNLHECGIAYPDRNWSTRGSAPTWYPCSKLVNHKGLCGYEDNTPF